MDFNKRQERQIEMPQKIRASVLKHCARHQGYGSKLMQSAAELSSTLLTSKPEAGLRPSVGARTFFEPYVCENNDTEKCDCVMCFGDGDERKHREGEAR